MAITVRKELDPVFETLGLLMSSRNTEAFKEAMINELDSFGMEGEAFYLKHLSLYDKYVREFAKRAVPDERMDFFFSEREVEFAGLMISVIARNAQWLEPAGELNDAQIRREIDRYLKDSEELSGRPRPEEQGGEEEALKAASPWRMADTALLLEQSALSDGTKWKLLQVMQYPKERIGELLRILEANLPAFEAAVKALGQPLHKLLQRFEPALNGQAKPETGKWTDLLDGEACVVPSLIMPLACQIVEKEKAYFGLYMDELPAQRPAEEESREVLLIRLKALGDNSKLTILSMLKRGPKYNLEIAEELGISAATASHHMNVLLACGLVTIEKQAGKVYYRPDRDKLERFVEELGRFLL